MIRLMMVYKSCPAHPRSDSHPKVQSSKVFQDKTHPGKIRQKDHHYLHLSDLEGSAIPIWLFL
jgi:hypothetical protein